MQAIVVNRKGRAVRRRSSPHTPGQKGKRRNMR
jgi:hypothetical protein